MSALDYTVEFSDPALRELVLASLAAPVEEHVNTESIAQMASSILSNMADDSSVLSAFESLVSMTEEIREERAVKKPKVTKVVAPKVEAVEVPLVDNIFLDKVKNILNKKPIVDTFDLSRQITTKTSTSSTDQIQVVIVGVGGTGSRIAPMIAQLMLSRSNIRLTFVDPDIVESKNLLRQNFYDFEVGSKKSEALKDRFEAIYGINIESVPLTFNNFTVQNRINSLIIFDCTDNLEARKQIESYINFSNTIRGLKEVVLISCGNQKDFGQVHFSCYYPPAGVGIKNFNSYLGNTYHSTNGLLFGGKLHDIFLDIHKLNDNFASEEINFLPTFLQFNKDFKDSTESISCANFDIAEEQSMAINSTIAQIAFNMFFEFMSTNGIRHNIVWANLTNSYSGNQINTVEKYLEFMAKTVFGKNIIFELDKYISLLQDYSFVYNDVNVELSNLSLTSFSESLAAHYINPSIVTVASTWYFSPEQLETIINKFYTDCESVLDEAIFNNLTKENFGESYLKYSIVIKFICFTLYEIFTLGKGKIQRTGQERIVTGLLDKLNEKYINIILAKQTEYNMLILKPGV